MNFTPVKTPLIVQKLFPKYTWEIASHTKEIYLTFDDGPTPEITTWVLDLLKEYHAKATFFCIGKNIEVHPQIFQKIITDGHSIGNHTNNHLKGWKTPVVDYLKNVESAQETIVSMTNNSGKKSTKLFRPPYGQLSPKQGTELIKKGYKIIMWSVLSIDWDDMVPQETCLKNVLNKSQSGSIVVFHDSKKAFKNLQYTLPKVLDYFSKKGFAFKSIPV